MPAGANLVGIGLVLGLLLLLLVVLLGVLYLFPALIFGSIGGALAGAVYTYFGGGDLAYQAGLGAVLGVPVLLWIVLDDAKVHKPLLGGALLGAVASLLVVAEPATALQYTLLGAVAGFALSPTRTEETA